MSDRTDHPPSPDDGSNRGRSARRAVAGGVAGIALLVGPVLVANALVPGEKDGKDAVEAAGSDTSIVALRRNATQRDQARADALISMRTTTTLPPTTTTTEPPTTTTTTAPPPTAPPSSGGGFGDPNDYATWDALAECESGGNWHINTGNGYYGGLQFSLSSWRLVGGAGMPHEASVDEQIMRAGLLWDIQGWNAWPVCSRRLGLR